MAGVPDEGTLWPPLCCRRAQWGKGGFILQPHRLGSFLTMHLVDISQISCLIDLSHAFIFGLTWYLLQPPINVKFEIPYFTTSGIQVRTILRLNSLEVVGGACDIFLRLLSIRMQSLKTFDCTVCSSGPLPEDHRKVRIPGELNN